MFYHERIFKSWGITLLLSLELTGSALLMNVFTCTVVSVTCGTSKTRACLPWNIVSSFHVCVIINTLALSLN